MLFVLVVFYGLLLWFVLLFLFAWPDVCCCCVFVIYMYKYMCVWVRAALFWVESFRDANWILIVLEFTSQSPLRYFSRCMNTDNIHLYAIILLWKTQRLLQHYRRYRFNLFTQCCFWQGLSRASKCFCCASNCTGGMSTAATEEAEDLRLTYLFTVRSDRDVAFYCLWWNFWIIFLQRCSASKPEANQTPRHHRPLLPQSQWTRCQVVWTKTWSQRESWWLNWRSAGEKLARRRMKWKGLNAAQFINT